MTRQRLVAYMAALSLTVGALVASATAGGFRDHGVVLPNGAVRIDADRYRLPDPWEATLKFYRAVYKPAEFPRAFVVDQPGIRAIHVADPDPKGEWDGFNLYELHGEVRMYVLARAKK